MSLQSLGASYDEVFDGVFQLAFGKLSGCVVLVDVDNGVTFYFADPSPVDAAHRTAVAEYIPYASTPA